VDDNILETMWSTIIDPKYKFFEKENELYKKINLKQQLIESFLKINETVYHTSEPFHKFFSKKSDFEVIWYPIKFSDVMSGLSDLLTTPFVMEIMVESLPKMGTNTISEPEIRNRFLSRLNGFECAEAEWRSLSHIISKVTTNGLLILNNEPVSNIWKLSPEDFNVLVPQVLRRIKEALTKVKKNSIDGEAAREFR
jgi:hypothetical protein